MANRKIQVTLTDALYSEFTNAAAESGVTVASYLRTMAYKQMMSERNAKQVINFLNSFTPEQFAQISQEGFKEMRERSGSHEQQKTD